MAAGGCGGVGTGDDEQADWEAEEMSGFIYRDFWALLWPDGRWFIDTDGKSQTDCWKIGLGWPSADEIETAKSMGVRCVQVKARAPQ